MTHVEVRKFKIDWIGNDANILITGKTCAGKTHLAKHLLREKKLTQGIVVGAIDAAIDSSEEYADFQELKFIGMEDICNMVIDEKYQFVLFENVREKKQWDSAIRFLCKKRKFSLLCIVVSQITWAIERSFIRDKIHIAFMFDIEPNVMHCKRCSICNPCRQEYHPICPDSHASYHFYLNNCVSNNKKPFDSDTFLGILRTLIGTYECFIPYEGNLYWYKA